MEPFQNAQVYSGMLKDQSPLHQRRGNIIQTSLEMEWESSSEFFNSGLRGSSFQDSFTGSIPQISVKEDLDAVKRDINENCSAGHLDHRDHTYACIAQGKGKSLTKEEANLETTSMSSSWWQPPCIPPAILATSNVSPFSDF